MNKKDLEHAIQGLQIIEKRPEEVPVKVDMSKLSVIEKRHMEAFIAKGMPNIENYDKDALLEAYLSGADVQELVQMFPDVEAGGIVYLKNTEHWNSLRKEVLEELQYKSLIKLMRTKANAVSSVSVLVDLFHKEIQPKILQYVVSGNPDHLPKKFGIKNFNDYKNFISLLEKISKLSPGAAVSLEPPVVNIKTENLNIGDDNRSVGVGGRDIDDEKVQSVAHKLLADFYGKGK